jgi:hypothetical protein
VDGSHYPLNTHMGTATNRAPETTKARPGYWLVPPAAFCNRLLADCRGGRQLADRGRQRLAFTLAVRNSDRRIGGDPRCWSRRGAPEAAGLATLAPGPALFNRGRLVEAARVLSVVTLPDALALLYVG